MAHSLTKALLLAASGCAVVGVGRAFWRRRNPYDFTDKVVLITGGSRGLGLLLARELASVGARVAICARDEAELARVQHEFAPLPVELLTLMCDVTDPEQVEQMVRTVEEQWGGVDVLINNAGRIQVGPAETMTLADYEDAMQIHFWAPLYTLGAVLPGMRGRRAGRIVNITSIGGKISAPHLLPYNASKFALVGLSEGLGAELAKDGIKVTTVCPGLMRTGSPRHAEFKGQHRAEYAWFSIADSIPGLSMDARRAARQIVDACRYGQAEVVLSLPAQLATLIHGILPGLTTETLSLVNRLLPGANGHPDRLYKGSDSQSRWSPSWLTHLTDEAARRNNELGGEAS